MTRQPVYEALTGFFAQDDGGSVGPVPCRFGLLDSSPDRWTKFRSRIAQLNKDACTGTSYKVIFFGRHGEGFHNVAEAKYGTKAWDDYWSKINGDGEMIWGPDADLTEIGKGQAVTVRTAWKTELPYSISLPEKLYTSPLTRAMLTNTITFDGVITDENRKTVVLEDCREENGVHTCDKRRTRTYIRTQFPRFEIEEGLTEEDELWDPDARETKQHVRKRARAVLDRIFGNDVETFISITAHGGIINEFLTAIGRPYYPLLTGGVIPVVVKAIG